MRTSLLAVAVCVLASIAAVDATLLDFPPENILCNTTAGFDLQCGGDPKTCTGLSVQGAVADECGGGGGHAFWAKHSDIWSKMLGLAATNYQATRWIFKQNQGLSTGNLVRGGSEGSQNTWGKMTGRLVPGRCYAPGLCVELWKLSSNTLTELDAIDLELNFKWRAAPTWGGTGDSKTKMENRCVGALGSAGFNNLWFNYDLDETKNNTFTGVAGGRLEGLLFHLRLAEGRVGTTWENGGRGRYGVHYGVGASQKHGNPATSTLTGYGISSWIRFDYERGLTYPTAYNQGNGEFQCCEMSDGDLNLALECGCGCYCNDPVNNCQPPSQICGNGIQEGSEECDTGGLGCCDENCNFRNSSTVCRPSAGPCDVEETCDGSSIDCPADGFKPNTEYCGGRFGLCDVADSVTCPGTSADCPGDAPFFHDTNLGPLWAFGYNVISFRNWVATTSDVQGRVAVKYNFTAGNGYSIGDQLCTGLGECCDFPMHHNLFVGGDAWWGSGRLYPDQKAPDATPAAASTCKSVEEVAFIGGVNHATGASSPIGDGEQQCGSCDGKGGPGCVDAEFDAVHFHYSEFSHKLGRGVANTHWFQEYQGVHIVCDNDSDLRYYVNFPDGSAISSSTWWTINGCKQNAEFIINIAGSDNVTLSGGTLSTIAERTIFNIPGDRTVFVANTAVFGSILAVNATYRQTGSVVWGIVIVGDAPETWQVNWPKCSLFWDVVGYTQIGTELQDPQGDVNRRQAGTTECLPKSVLKVRSHGIFLPNDQVTIGVSPSESATIKDLLTINGQPAFEFTSDLVNSYNEGVPIEMKVADPGNQNRPPYQPKATTFPCSTTASVTTDASTATLSMLVIVATMLIALL